MDIFLGLFIIVILTSIFGVLFLVSRNKNLKKDILGKQSELIDKEKEMNSKMYELAILKELGDRVGYSLDVHQIIDVITGSLHQFINYSIVSYMILEPEKVLFKIHLEKSVNRKFINDVRDRMIKSLGALLDREFKTSQIEEYISGAILIEEVEEPVKSFFNIPLVIAGKVVGVLTVADTQSGLYKESEMTILYKITNQASQAVTRLQEVVATEQGKLNAMVSSMADGIAMTDLDYRIYVINSAAKKAIGVSEDKEVSIFDFIDGLGGKFDIRGRLEESIKLKKEYTSDRILLGEKFFQIFVYPVKNVSILGQETIYGGVIIFHDVTSEVEIESLRKEFTSMLVHELRSPLDGIKKISEVLRNKEIKLEANSYGEYVDLIYKNSSGMLEMVNDILDVAKIEAGKFDIKKEEADIKKSIKDRVDFYSVSTNDSKVDIKTFFNPNLPEKMMFDTIGVDHVLNNLISNSLKYTNKDKNIEIIAFLHNKGEDINQELKFSSHEMASVLPEDLNKKDTAVVVLVSDNGIGIKEEEIPIIFNKFKQLDNKENLSIKMKGTGLGLFITKSIVEEHGGSIGVISKIGNGSTFFFTLPLI